MLVEAMSDLQTHEEAWRRREGVVEVCMYRLLNLATFALPCRSIPESPCSRSVDTINPSSHTQLPPLEEHHKAKT